MRRDCQKTTAAAHAAHRLARQEAPELKGAAQRIVAAFRDGKFGSNRIWCHRSQGKFLKNHDAMGEANYSNSTITGTKRSALETTILATSKVALQTANCVVRPEHARASPQKTCLEACVRGTVRHRTKISHSTSMSAGRFANGVHARFFAPSLSPVRLCPH